MKFNFNGFNGVLAFGLVACFLVIDAAAPGKQAIRIINNSGYDIEFEIGKSEKAEGVLGTSYSHEIIPANKKVTLSDISFSDITKLGVRYPKDTWGYQKEGLAVYDKIDIPDLKEHPGKNLQISISGSYGGFGAWDIKWNWLEPSGGEGVDEAWEAFKPGEWTGGWDEQPAKAEEEPKDAPQPAGLAKPPLKGTPYEMLGVKEGAARSEIKKAYVKLTRTYHPDKYTGDDAAEITSRITRANRVLSDEDDLRTYNRYKNPKNQDEEYLLSQVWPSAYWHDKYQK